MTSEAMNSVSETYEGLRDSVENVEARAAWNDADRRRTLLTDTYRTLRDDPRYTEEHKSEQMWERYEKESVHIQAAGEKARELLEREAKGHEMMALPHPKGENLHGISTERLIAAQNEASRVTRKLDRLEAASGPKKLKPPTARILKDEYARGMEVGGVEGAAICKGVLMAADELGISEDEFLNSLRTPEQLAMLDKAERCRRMAFSIPNNVPEPPLGRPGQHAPSGAGKLFIPRSAASTAHTKKPLSWVQRERS